MSFRKKINALSEENPRLRQIEAELHGVFISLIEGADPVEAETRKAHLLSERNSVLRSMNETKNIYTSSCSLCGDSLFVDDKPCKCLIKAYADIQTKKLAFHVDIKRMNFDNFLTDIYSGKIVPEYGISHRSNIEILREKCQDYAEDFEHMKTSLFFNGGVGTGKTFLSSCIAGKVSGMGFWVTYITAIDMFSVLEAHKFDRENTDIHSVKSFYDCDLLIIDDLGMEFNSSFVQSSLYHVVNSRLCKHKKTIINSNLMLDDFRLRYAPQTVSRIEGEYELMFFFGRDLRLA